MTPDQLRDERRAEHILADEGVFAGHGGLRGLYESREFWQTQPYGTRLYYGGGGQQYLHHSVLGAAIDALDKMAELKRAHADALEEIERLKVEKQEIAIDCLDLMSRAENAERRAEEQFKAGREAGMREAGKLCVYHYEATRDAIVQHHLCGEGQEAELLRHGMIIAERIRTAILSAIGGGK